MRRFMVALSFVLLPSLGMAEPLKVENAVVPLTPPTSMAHAAYMTLHNVSKADVELIGASAEGYAMTHLHLSEEKDGIATMTAVDAVKIEPEQHVMFQPGGLHIMLMRPEAALEDGATIPITLLYADGTEQKIEAAVIPRDALQSMSHNHGS